VAAVEMQELQDILGAEEPAYDLEVLSDPGIVPLLAELFSGADRGMAAKAVSVASHIPDAQAVALVRNAAESDDQLIRVAAAAGARNLTADIAGEILGTLVRDEEPGVRYMALDSVRENSTSELLAVVEEVRNDDEDDAVRDHAKEVLEGLA
jgi:hypothetical protein